MKVNLYHGTSDFRIGSILKEGIIPRGDYMSNWDHLPSRPDLVYLTTGYAFYFAMYTMMTDRANWPAIFEVEVSDNDLVPDEDFFFQLFEKHYSKKNKGFDDNVLRYVGGDKKVLARLNSLYDEYSISRDEPFNGSREFFASELDDLADLAIPCLKYLGTCSHLGRVRPNKITRYTVLDMDTVWDLGLDKEKYEVSLDYFNANHGSMLKLVKKEIWEKPLSFGEDMYPDP